MYQAIRSLLADHPWRDKLQYFDSLDSTNTYAKKLASDGAPAGTVVIADHQTGGRGRLGRSFSSPAGMGIYMSVILRPDCHPEALMHLTCATGVAASDAIEAATGVLAGIKWTNDLVLGKRKLGGILTEISVDQGTRNVDWAVIGIGINCCQKEGDFPPEIRTIAGSLLLKPEDRPALAAELIRRLFMMNNTLLSKKDAIMEAFRGRCVTIGQEISIHRGDEIRHGKAIAVDNDGGLVVEYADGHRQTVTSGEVSIRGMYGYL